MILFLIMHNIKSDCTSHEENGRCSPDELVDIINTIRPDIIFEELTVCNLNRAYKEGIQVSLETDAIKRYLLSHDVERIPVDT